MGKEVVVTEANFETEVAGSDVPVLVDFWAEWCVPCKMIAPTLEEIAEEHDGALKIGKVNVDEEPGLASKYNIISIPTILLFKDGEVVNQHVGAGPKPLLESIFKNFI